MKRLWYKSRLYLQKSNRMAVMLQAVIAVIKWSIYNWNPNFTFSLKSFWNMWMSLLLLKKSSYEVWIDRDIYIRGSTFGPFSIITNGKTWQDLYSWSKCKPEGRIEVYITEMIFFLQYQPLLDNWCKGKCEDRIELYPIVVEWFLVFWGKCPSKHHWDMTSFCVQFENWLERQR